MPSTQRSISVGDVVQLRAGGPSMRAHAVRRDVVRCVWFVRDAEESMNFGYFHTSLLVRVLTKDPWAINN